MFHGRNWFRLLQSKSHPTYPAKDAVYRFLNCSTYAWRRFLLLLSSFTIRKMECLTSANRVKVLIVDDSPYERNRSTKVELLSRCHNHNPGKNRFYSGFRMLTLGWSDGFSFLPLDFALISSRNSLLNGIDDSIDKRSSGYKRRMEAGINIIGMVTDQKQRYEIKGNSFTLKQLFAVAQPIVGQQPELLRPVHVTLKSVLPVKLVFIQNRKITNFITNQLNQWKAGLPIYIQVHLSISCCES